jgi:uncharacterized protein YggE
VVAWPASQSIEHPVGANVYGSAVLRTEPDRALAEIGVARVAATAKAAFSETGKAVEAVVKSVRRNNIAPEAVEVSRVVLTSAHEGFGQAQKFIGYRARVTFRILIGRLDGVEKILADAVEAGANEVVSVKYLTTHLAELRAQARREAVFAARRKAEVYCGAAGVSLGHVLHIEDLNPDSMVNRAGHLEATGSDMQDDDAAPGALMSGSLVVSAAVMVTWSILHD